jgi:RHS repeat-associated protein
MLCTGAGWVDPRLFFVSTGTQTIKHDRRYDQLFANNTAGGDIGGMSGTIQKAGNISQLAWRIRGRERQSYSFSYDHLSRLSTATYYDVNGSNTATNTNLFNESLTYDLRGNIFSLQRNGYYASSCNYGDIDNLSFTYTTGTNQIASIADYAPFTQRSQGFNPGAGGAGYTYDANGNLKTDSYKGISNISYNHLNLPGVITYTSGNTIEWVYDAAGMKLRKIVKVGATIQYEQTYLGGLEYRKNGTGSTRVEAVYHDEGRYLNLNAEVNNTLLWQKEYTIKDHLGNARITFTDKNGNGMVDIPTDIVQENHYYPFGYNYEGSWRMNDAGRDHKYKYNGKELNEDFGLNWYDYGFRYYDPTIGRFTGVDPIADKFAHVSPYNYAENEPVAHIDLWGLQKVLAIFYHGGPTGGGKTTTPEKAGPPSSDIYNRMQSASTAEGRDFKGRMIAPGWTSASATANGLGFVKDNYEEGDQVVLYGYSYGVDPAVDLATELQGENIPVDLLITVDGSDGPLQNSTVDKTIPENVNTNLNIYQTEDSGTSSSSATFGKTSSNSSSASSSSNSGTSNSPGSNGSPNNAANPNRTTVINKNVTAPGTTHGNIQQKQMGTIQSTIDNRIKQYCGYCNGKN